MEYTKGEWHQSEQWWYRVYDSGGRIVATIDFTIRKLPESLANANLISASPDLYEALNDLMDLQGINDGIVTVRACPSAESILRAQKALMKAAGK